MGGHIAGDMHSLSSILYSSGSLRLPNRPGWPPNQTRPNPPPAAEHAEADPSFTEEPVIERAEVVALLFNVSDIASSLDRIEQLLGEDDGEEEADGS
jgi:hypothetical protein